MHLQNYLKSAFTFTYLPRELLSIRKFNKKAILLLLENIRKSYMKSLVHPGDMCGIVAAQEHR